VLEHLGGDDDVERVSAEPLQEAVSVQALIDAGTRGDIDTEVGLGTPGLERGARSPIHVLGPHLENRASAYLVVGEDVGYPR